MLKALLERITPFRMSKGVMALCPLLSFHGSNILNAAIHNKGIIGPEQPSEGIPSYLAASSGCRCALANQMASLGSGGLGFRLYPALAEKSQGIPSFGRCPIFFRPRSRLRIWSLETGSAVPSRISLLILHTLRLNLVTRRISPAFRDGLHLFTPSIAIGPVPNLSATQLRTDGVHYQEAAGTGPVALKLILIKGAAFSGITMYHVLCASRFSMPTILRRERGQGNIHLPLTTRRIVSLTRLIHTLLYVMTMYTCVYTCIPFRTVDMCDTEHI